MSAPISSSSNTKIKLVRSLQNRRRSRISEAAFVAEGVRLVEEALTVHWPIEFILYDENISDRGIALIDKFRSAGTIEVFEITASLMKEISDTETPQGILAVLKHQRLPFPDSPGFLIIADQVRDPGNMGTLLRTAEAAGAEAVLLSPGTVDPFSPKVIRASMGAHFHLPIIEKSWYEIKTSLHGFPVFLADPAGGTSLWEANFMQPCALLIGGEAFGASQPGEAVATHRVTIPMKGRVESLNAAIAAGILIAEVLRQRHQKDKD